MESGIIYQGIYPYARIESFTKADLAAGKPPRIDCTIGAQQNRPYGIVGSGGKVFGGGNIFFGYDGIPVDTQAKLLIFDESTQQPKTITWPVPNTRSVNAAATAADGTVWFSAEGWLLAMDPATEQWVHREEIFPGFKPGPRIAGNYGSMVTGTDGRIYGNVGGRVFGFDPAKALANGSTAGDLKIHFQGAGPHLTQDSYGNLYVPYDSTKLVRINPR